MVEKDYKPLTHRYSGEKSKRFWKFVNSLKEPYRTELYGLGVVLQNIEDHVLKRLKDESPKSVKKEKFIEQRRNKQ